MLADTPGTTRREEGSWDAEMVASTAAREMVMDIARGPDAVPPFGDDSAVAARAIAALRTAQFDATIDFDDGTSLGMQLRFDLGAGAEPARLYVVAIARRGAVITQAGEFVQVGERSWQRQADGSWLPGEIGGDRAASAESIRRRVNALLPRLESGQRPSIDRAPDLSLLTWNDEALNAEMLLEIEPTSGIPRRFRRETRSTGTVLTVLCSNWNRAVQINPPDVPGGRPAETRDTPLR